MALLTVEKLQTYYRKIDIIQATANQIIKDFSIFEEEITFSGQAEAAYGELYDQIYPIIDRLLNLDSARFFSMLYAIDVDERKVKKLLFGEHNSSAVEGITKLIIERELIKVVYRKYWREFSKSD